MKDIVTTEVTDIISVIKGDKKDITLIKPFENEIFLFDTYIAGTNFIPGIDDLFELLKTGEKLSFFREPDNKYDKEAIVIKTANKVKLGYVPKSDNVIFARLMDAGKYLYGKIENKIMHGTWAKIEIKVYLKE